MAHAVKKNSQTLIATILGNDYEFVVGRDDYNKYINSVTAKEKVAPSHNFLMQTVSPASLEQLKKVLEENPGAEVQIASAILEDYTPDLGIVVKKSSAVLTA